MTAVMCWSNCQNKTRKCSFDSRRHSILGTHRQQQKQSPSTRTCGWHTNMFLCFSGQSFTSWSFLPCISYTIINFWQVKKDPIW